MQGITPHLWFDTQALEAAQFYCSRFPNSRLVDVVSLDAPPTGDVESIYFELFGQPFMAISAGPMVTIDPSISFAVACASPQEVDDYYAEFSADGKVWMELGSYPFSERYAWVEDRYGVSWQFSFDGGQDMGQRITPTLLFVGDVAGCAKEAVEHYVSIFPDAQIEAIFPYDPDDAPHAEPGDIAYARFSLAGQEFAAMDSRLDHDFSFNEAVSLLITCEDQEELDRYADALSTVPEAEQCGWVKDRYGVSWQVWPAELGVILTEGTDVQKTQVTQAFLAMKRFDLAELRRAYEEALIA